MGECGAARVGFQIGRLSIRERLPRAGPDSAQRKRRHADRRDPRAARISGPSGLPARRSCCAETLRFPGDLVPGLSRDSEQQPIDRPGATAREHQDDETATTSRWDWMPSPA